MKAIVTAAAIFAFILVSIALLNLYILFDKGNCMCSNCLGSCVLKNQEVPAECTEFQYENLDCMSYSCKEIFGRCTKTPKLLEFNTHIRGY